MSNDDEEPTPHMMIATCRTPHCPMNNIGEIAPFYPNATPPTYRGQCAQCGQTHTDIVPVP
ncbi:hypothetical protein [Streptomyces parvus]|uniref:Uncharacterized protein n=1 Tax=Streptomyces parvus TaxID=66428 RepID=A0A7K3RZ58_9ACTN|nr:hypothetical protein [Streptomyces parvus]NEC20507.1 hypothetical protein [Streptomyces parvus]